MMTKHRASSNYSVPNQNAEITVACARSHDVSVEKNNSKDGDNSATSQQLSARCWKDLFAGSIVKPRDAAAAAKSKVRRSRRREAEFFFGRRVIFMIVDGQ
jgi:hypothetical protein